MPAVEDQDPGVNRDPEYEQSKQHVTEHGVDIIFEEERNEGVFHGKQFYFHDPDRNVLEIIALEKVADGFAPEKLMKNETFEGGSPKGVPQKNKRKMQVLRAPLPGEPLQKN